MKAPLHFSYSVAAAPRIAAPVPGGSVPPPTELPPHCEGHKGPSKVKSTHDLDLEDCTGHKTAVKQSTQLTVKNTFAKEAWL